MVNIGLASGKVGELAIVREKSRNVHFSRSSYKRFQEIRPPGLYFPKFSYFNRPSARF